MTTTLSPFALPERLHAKSDPALIDADELHFASIAATIEASLAAVQAQLDAVRLTAGRAGQAALDRDLEAHRLLARLRTLRRFGLDLCLGRMVGDDGAVVYVGRLGLTGSDGEPLLVDWRSPAAEPFFGATHARPMGLVSRRRYRWRAGRVTDYWDEALAGEVGQLALDDESAFIASLGEGRSSRMRDVLGTIQADQDAIIRAGSRGALVVDGGPGTGKTVVALHRAAYLLHSDPRLSQRRGGVLFVGPTDAYLGYVSDVLPNLGEDGVVIATLRDLVHEGVDADPERDDRVAALKSTGDLVRAITTAVRRYEQPPTTTVAVETDWAELSIGPAEWADAFAGVEPGTPHDEAREQVWDELLQMIVDRHDEEVPAAVLREQLGVPGGSLSELREVFDRAWPMLDPGGVVAELLSSPRVLAECAPWLSADEVDALQRDDPRAWTLADLPLLDAARDLVGDPEASDRERRRAAAAMLQSEQMSLVVDDIIAADDDGEAYVTMLRVEDAQHSLVDDDALPSHEPDELAGPFAHVIVDEAQELTDAEWLMLLRRCPSRSLTIVGDRAQARQGFAERWDARLTRVGVRQPTIARLTVNYRTPSEIMEVAEPVIRAALPDANVPTSIRSSGLPVEHVRLDALEGIIGEWLAAHDEGMACVIALAPVDIGALAGSDRVRQMRPETVKGLEFDLVAIVDADVFGGGHAHGGGIEGAVDRYVAMTRATERLVLVTS